MGNNTLGEGIFVQTGLSDSADFSAHFLPGSAAEGKGEHDKRELCFFLRPPSSHSVRDQFEAVPVMSLTPTQHCPL